MKVKSRDHEMNSIVETPLAECVYKRATRTASETAEKLSPSISGCTLTDGVLEKSDALSIRVFKHFSVDLVVGYSHLPSVIPI